MEETGQVELEGAHSDGECSEILISDPANGMQIRHVDPDASEVSL